MDLLRRKLQVFSFHKDKKLVKSGLLFETYFWEQKIAMGSSQGCKSYLPKVHSRIYYTKYMVVQISLIFRSFRTSSICSSLVLVSMELVWEPRYSTAREIKSWVCFSYISLVLSHLQGNNFRLFLAVFISKVLPLTFLRIKFYFLGLFHSSRIHSDAQTFLKSACLTKGSSCR